MPLEPTFTAALIQGSIDTSFEPDEERPARIREHYAELTRSALQRSLSAQFAQAGQSLPSLVIWPESIYQPGIYDFAPEFSPPPQLEKKPAEAALQSRREVAEFLQSLMPQNWPAERDPPAFIIGMDRAVILSMSVPPPPPPGQAATAPTIVMDRFNSAIFFSGQLVRSPEKIELTSATCFARKPTWHLRQTASRAAW